MKKRVLFVLVLLISFCLPLGLSSHGGRTDSLGCHHNRKAGGYHCHSGPLAGRSFASKVEAQAALRGRGSTAPVRPAETTASTSGASEVENLRKELAALKAWVERLEKLHR